MDSSEESNLRSIDASVGGLVWVRRRNGSWWPGRIVSLDELSESSLVSPKSGTPVKLLGRDDASIDWYNLEKSMRVKAFRCGEYDKCIEKAKASAASSSKKKVKYARREDAILHALEIENALLPNDGTDFCSETQSAHGNRNSGWAKESFNASHSSEEDQDTTEEASTLEDNSNSTQELSQSGLSFEEPNQISPSKVQPAQGKRRTPNDSEDDGREGIKRMRGLEDLGMGVLAKGKLQAGADLDLVHQDTTPCDPSAANGLTVGNHLNGNKKDSLLRRKRSQVTNLQELIKRKNRRRPLTKVLESAAILSVPVMCDELKNSSGSPLQGLSDNKVLQEDTTDLIRNYPILVNNSPSSNGILSENGFLPKPTESGEDAAYIQSKNKEIEMLGTSDLIKNALPDTLFDVPFVVEGKDSAGFPSTYPPCSFGKFQIGDIERQCNWGSQEGNVALNNESLIESGSTSSTMVHVNNISQSIEKGTSKWKSKGKRKLRHSSKNKKQLQKFIDIADIEQRDELSLDSTCMVDNDGHLSYIRGPADEVKHLPDCSRTPLKLLPHRQSRYTVHPKYRTTNIPVRNYCVDSFLYDVNVEVKAGYRPQHVPLVSLMSKLDGKAIVGHPLTVEVLAEGSCDHTVSGGNLNDSFSGSISNFEGSEMGSAIKLSTDKNKTSKYGSIKTRSPSKVQKSRKNGFMSKKIRKLSSLTGAQMLSQESLLLVEKAKGPVVSCIPLKVVFSRLNEAVNGSARPENGS